MDKMLLINRHRMLVGAYDPFSEYQQVEWIQSSGTQYINLNVHPDSSTIVQIDFTNIEYTGYCIIGYYNSGADDFRLFNHQQVAYLDYGAADTTHRIYGNSINSNQRYYLEFGNLYVKNLTSGTILISGNPVSFAEKSTDIYLCGNSNYSKNRFYSIKIYKNNGIVRDFIPCYHKTTGVIGLWDKVSKQFFTNSGTGVFTKGSDVN